MRSRIIPVLLLNDGGLIKTRQFRAPKYVGDPVNAVRIFNEKEVDELALFDVGATVNDRPPSFALLAQIAAESRMPLMYGGGVRSAEVAARVLALGFEKISISSAAVERRRVIEETAHAIGSQSTVVTLDLAVDGSGGGYRLVTHNATRDAMIPWEDMLSDCERFGAGEVVLNCVDREGARGGCDLDLALRARSIVSLPITIVGGVGHVSHMEELITALGPIGVGVGTYFTFTGKYDAVMISYRRPGH